ncbi:helix-turn-helix transcriptional regulator [Zooshikella ganghwensis]|uniref:XRE family transcriptional regulator n=1 Tax=Zooshikella ganghwensis TaxID=202772 RepID=A0A4P9VMK7_9GAMM|nr:helix-turn-helix transcriptional regulator [Zooshikella ganghwensis]RDH44635.1 XRE family transcriptional regulator [Zooshikella ganghwensis]
MSDTQLWERIKVARINAGLTQGDLARICQVTRTTTSRWESEDPEIRRKPRLSHLQKIAEATGQDIKFFFRSPNLSSTLSEARSVLMKETDSSLKEKSKRLLSDLTELVIDEDLCEVEVDMLLSIVSSIKDKAKLSKQEL